MKRKCFLAAALAASFVFAGMASAEPQSPCKSLETVKQEAHQHAFVAVGWTAVGRDLTQSYLALYNATPPVSQFAADHMVVALAARPFRNGAMIMPAGTALLVLQDANDCVTMLIIVHPRHHDPIMRTLSAKPETVGTAV